MEAQAALQQSKLVLGQQITQLEEPSIFDDASEGKDKELYTVRRPV
jgi:hypothetical protein